MPRSVTLGLALSVLVTACALVSEPVPPGTVPIQARITNITGQPQVVWVESASGGAIAPIPGAVQPSGPVPAHSAVDVTIYGPRTDEWEVEFSDGLLIPGSDIRAMDCQLLVIEVDHDGSGTYGCTPP